ncbi:MAG TPA: hypothetical protein PLP04_08175 [Bryobacteraceae bacterium]|nr:hypothetical protein [Bryobacteraceae bacterium]HPQ15190.1 hypothetical protein [Bryobacteraceae bacterium]
MYVPNTTPSLARSFVTVSSPLFAIQMWAPSNATPLAYNVEIVDYH